MPAAELKRALQIARASSAAIQAASAEVARNLRSARLDLATRQLALHLSAVAGALKRCTYPAGELQVLRRYFSELRTALRLQGYPVPAGK